jgi:signal transduction histidine kinase
VRLLPRSLAGRLLVTAAGAIALALGLAAFSISHVLERFVTQDLDERLDAQLAVLARAIAPGGGLRPGAVADLPPFDRPGSGWAWQVTAPDGMLRSGSLQGAPLPPEPPRPAPDRSPPRPPHDDPPPPGPDPAVRPHPFESRDPAGLYVHGRALTIASPSGPVELIATGPRELIEQPLRAAAAPLFLSVALLAGLLAAAILVQLRIGLRPLARLGTMLAEVRAGTRARVEATEPSELLPLVGELNALIDANEAQLARARLHASNLAHGLKTPLAALRIELAAPGRDPDGRLAEQVSRLEGQVRHHLSRARAADRGREAAPAVALDAVVIALADALRRIHADRAIEAVLDIPAALSVRCDPQDLDEALGNLIDNGWQHAAHRLWVSAGRQGRLVAIRIEDDGTGLSDAALAALDAGERPADERPGGHGQGLRIARELVELHGGTLALTRAPAGGLSATVTLPAAAA